MSYFDDHILRKCSIQAFFEYGSHRVHCRSKTFINKCKTFCDVCSSWERRSFFNSIAMVHGLMHICANNIGMWVLTGCRKGFFQVSNGEKSRHTWKIYHHFLNNLYWQCIPTMSCLFKFLAMISLALVSYILIWHDMFLFEHRLMNRIHH